MNIDDNTLEHNTNDYEITKDDPTRQRPRQLVVRRGQRFTLKLHLDRNYVDTQDNIFLIMEIGRLYDVHYRLFLVDCEIVLHRFCSK